jgi:hypothetical protein
MGLRFADVEKTTVLRSQLIIDWMIQINTVLKVLQTISAAQFRLDDPDLLPRPAV